MKIIIFILSLLILSSCALKWSNSYFDKDKFLPSFNDTQEENYTADINFGPGPEDPTPTNDRIEEAPELVEKPSGWLW